MLLTCSLVVWWTLFSARIKITLASPAGDTVAHISTFSGDSGRDVAHSEEDRVRSLAHAQDIQCVGLNSEDSSVKRSDHLDQADCSADLSLSFVAVEDFSNDVGHQGDNGLLRATSPDIECISPHTSTRWHRRDTCLSRRQKDVSLLAPMSANTFPSTTSTDALSLISSSVAAVATAKGSSSVSLPSTDGPQVPETPAVSPLSNKLPPLEVSSTISYLQTLNITAATVTQRVGKRSSSPSVSSLRPSYSASYKASSPSSGVRTSSQADDGAAGMTSNASAFRTSATLATSIPFYVSVYNDTALIAPYSESPSIFVESFTSMQVFATMPAAGASVSSSTSPTATSSNPSSAVSQEAASSSGRLRMGITVAIIVTIIVVAIASFGVTWWVRNRRSNFTLFSGHRAFRGSQQSSHCSWFAAPYDQRRVHEYAEHSAPSPMRDDVSSKWTWNPPAGAADDSRPSTMLSTYPLTSSHATSAQSYPYSQPHASPRTSAGLSPTSLSQSLDSPVSQHSLTTAELLGANWPSVPALCLNRVSSACSVESKRTYASRRLPDPPVPPRTPRRAEDGGVRLAGGPLETVDIADKLGTDGNSGSDRTLPPVYGMY